MKWEQVQFAMNRHQVVGSSGYQPTQTSPVLEGEKCTILPGRKKRQSNAQDVALPEIHETDEGHVMHENVMDSRAPHADNVMHENVMDSRAPLAGHADIESEPKRYRTSSFTAFGNEENEKRQNENEMEDESVKVKSRGHKKRGSHGRMSDSESVAESEERVQEGANVDKTNVSPGRRKSKESNKVNQAVENTVPMLDILNVGSEYRHRKMDEMTECSSASKTSAKIAIVEDMGTPGLKLPEVRCAHHVIRPDMDEREEKLRQTLKWKRGKDSETGKCVICEITEATARYASVESNRLLLEIVYPHEYYDKYSRATKKAQSEPESQKETSICKPFKVAKKPRREKTYVQTPLFSDRPDPPNTLREGAEMQEKNENEYVTQDRKRKRELTETGFRKEIHLQCKPKANALVITDGCEGQKMVLKGLKGWILRRDDVCKDRVHKEIKQSLYQVNSLGMQFSIPEYNNALHDRKPMSPRPITSLVTSRLGDVGQSTFQLQRSYTQSPRGNQFILQADVSKDTQNGIQRGKTNLNLQRDPTNANITKLVSHSAVQENSRPSVTFRHRDNSNSYPSRGSDGSNQGKLLKGKLSLPPIAPEHKPSSVLSIGKHIT